MGEDDEDDKSFNDSDPEMFDNEVEPSMRQTQQNLTMADSDEDDAPPPPAVMDDDDSEVEAPKKKPVKQRKLGPKLDDEDSPLQKKKPTPKKRPAKDSDSEDDKPKRVRLVLF